MKLIEPLSSALLVTGCVYSAGVAQNSAFMRYFGVNPAFSQPAIDKIFYDGGLITFELFVRHVIIACLILFVSAIFVVGGVVVWSRLKRLPVRQGISAVKSFAKIAYGYLVGLSGFASLLYLIALTFFSYEKAQVDGEKIAEAFVDTCHVVVIQKGADQIKGCAFNKDRDSIWYYTVVGDAPKTSSKLLSELDQITYLDPQEL